MTVPCIVTSWPIRLSMAPLARAMPAVNGSITWSLTQFSEIRVKLPPRQHEEQDRGSAISRRYRRQNGARWARVGGAQVCGT